MKCNLKGCERTDEHTHGQSAYTAAGQTELGFKSGPCGECDPTFGCFEGRMECVRKEKK